MTDSAIDGQTVPCPTAIRKDLAGKLISVVDALTKLLINEDYWDYNHREEVKRAVDSRVDLALGFVDELIESGEFSHYCPTGPKYLADLKTAVESCRAGWKHAFESAPARVDRELEPLSDLAELLYDAEVPDPLHPYLLRARRELNRTCFAAYAVLWESRACRFESDELIDQMTTLGYKCSREHFRSRVIPEIKKFGVINHRPGYGLSPEVLCLLSNAKPT